MSIAWLRVGCVLSCHYVKTLRDFGVSLLSLLTFPRIYQPLTGPAEGQGGFIPPPLFWKF